ncbi:hypothetical protein SAMN06265222_102107 [Neorhodopirellula lusitana]|uniref:Secreted protein n=1 Tax=Neorhodopirellula lusitana TaxID=445327 RepID=A0ABY1PVZ9_9BACT|nr:hypothetical protein [Neorhodopirellula lusitana]SMP46326.1 hypothetical protein SAMN06265222_102107 [Neorhodopirellula lusitana]
MRLSLQSLFFASLFSVVCTGFSGCSDSGNTQIAPNPDAKTMTVEERADYNDKQTEMMIPKN